MSTRAVPHSERCATPHPGEAVRIVAGRMAGNATTLVQDPDSPCQLIPQAASHPDNP